MGAECNVPGVCDGVDGKQIARALANEPAIPRQPKDHFSKTNLEQTLALPVDEVSTTSYWVVTIRRLIEVMAKLELLAVENHLLCIDVGMCTSLKIQMPSSRM